MICEECQVLMFWCPPLLVGHRSFSRTEFSHVLPSYVEFWEMPGTEVEGPARQRAGFNFRFSVWYCSIALHWDCRHLTLRSLWFFFICRKLSPCLQGWRGWVTWLREVGDLLGSLTPMQAFRGRLFSALPLPMSLAAWNPLPIFPFMELQPLLSQSSLVHPPSDFQHVLDISQLVPPSGPFSSPL